MKVLTKFIDSWMWAAAIRPWFYCYILDYHDLALPQDQPCVRESRQTLFLGGRRLEEVQAGREERLPLVPPQLEPLRQLLKQTSWLGGKQPNYADYRVLACFPVGGIGRDDPAAACGRLAARLPRSWLSISMTGLAATQPCTPCSVFPKPNA